MVTPKGRLLATFCAYLRPDSIDLIAPGGQSAALLDRLSKTLVLADAQVEDLREGSAWVSLIGPGAAALAGSDAYTFSLEGPDRTLLRLPEPGSAEKVETVTGKVPEISESDFETLRIAAGRIRLGMDASDEHFPLEVGLSHAVSFEKGCYLGQETLAHIQNRGKLNRRLASLSLPKNASLGEGLKLGEVSVGSVTSMAVSPAGGKIGLSVLRSEAAEPGTELVTDQGSATVLTVPA